MDNVTPLVPDTNPSCDITLDPVQYAFYQHSCLEIQAPDGTVLKIIGKSIQQERDAAELQQLHDHALLLRSLLGKVKDQIELPPAAAAGLADLMDRAQRLCERVIK